MLKKVQDELAEQGYGLKIFDAYRGEDSREMHILLAKAASLVNSIMSEASAFWNRALV